MHHPGLLGEPLAEGLGVVPAYPHHRLIGRVQVLVLPVQGRGMASVLEKSGILGVGGLGLGQVKGFKRNFVGSGLRRVATGFGGGAPQLVSSCRNKAEL